MTLTLWYATSNYKVDGKWLPKTKLYEGEEKQPLYHLLYNTPLEAYLSLHNEINKFYANNGHALRIFIYSAKVCLIRKGNHIKPNDVAKLSLIEHTDLLPTHLVRQSVLFQRQANIAIEGPRSIQLSKKPIFDLHYKNMSNEETYLMPLSKLKVEYTKDTWSRLMLEDVEGIFDLQEANLAADFRLAPHEPNKLKAFKNVKKHSLA